MHESVMEYVERIVVANNLAHRRVIEVGSYNVNGSVRELFAMPDSYTGIDMRDGPGVDLVCHSWTLPFEDQSFEVGVTTEMLEHDEYPDRTMAELYRVLEPRGRVIVTARGPGYPPHDYPADYHRFDQRAMYELLKDAGFVEVATESDPQVPGTFATGVR